MLVDSIRRFAARHELRPARVVVAISGGADSTALLLAFADLRSEGWELVAAHVNHHLRGTESDDDEAFVRALCERQAIELHVAEGTLDAEAVKHRGIEAAAREVRFAKLREIREQTGAAYIATAHQKNDQAETIMMRLANGGGVGALRGIRAVREDGVIRPLLDVTRAGVDAFLAGRGVTPRVDSSNADPRFLRNRARAQLRGLGPGAIETFAAIAERAAQQWPLIEQAIDDAERACVEIESEETLFRNWPEDLWLRQALLHRHIRRLDPDARDVSAADLERLAASVDEIKRVSVTRSLELFRRGEALVLGHHQVAHFPEFESGVTPEQPATIAALGVTVHVARVSGARFRQRFTLPRGARAALVVRNRRRGDRFHPLGMQTDKKLKDFLIDRKIAADVRDRVPLLVWNGEIVWVAGVEISERFKVTDPTGDSQGELYEVWLEGAHASSDENPDGFQR
jgi:tRNA(Ile)-lysidine synthase